MLLPIGPHPVSTAICYEVVYPDLVRQTVNGGSQLLTTITNDAWFGRSSAPYQHFAQAAMRAIENGRYLVRVGQYRRSAASSIRTDGCWRRPASSSRRWWSAQARS